MTHYSSPAVTSALAVLQQAEATLVSRIDTATAAVDAVATSSVDDAIGRLVAATRQAQERIAEAVLAVDSWAADLVASLGAAAATLQAAFAPPVPVAGETPRSAAADRDPPVDPSDEPEEMPEAPELPQEETEAADVLPLERPGNIREEDSIAAAACAPVDPPEGDEEEESDDEPGEPPVKPAATTAKKRRNRKPK